MEMFNNLYMESKKHRRLFVLLALTIVVMATVYMEQSADDIVLKSIAIGVGGLVTLIITGLAFLSYLDKADSIKT